MLNDVSKCIGCRSCQVACKQWNQLPAVTTVFTGTYENPPVLSGKTWTRIHFNEVSENGRVRWLFGKGQCMHCTDATCVSVCPTTAARKYEGGFTLIDQSICAGCKNCVESCPFGSIQMDGETGTAKKCTMCYDRILNGLQPACAKACPTGAISFGSRDEILRKARARQVELSPVYPQARLYGQEELDGLGVMYVLPQPAALYGLPEQPRRPNKANWIKWAFGLIPGLAILFVLWKKLQTEDSKGGK